MILSAIATGTLGIATPAMADPAAFTVSTPKALVDFHPGDTQTLAFTVADATEVTSPTGMTATISITPVGSAPGTIANDFAISTTGCAATGNTCTFPLPAKDSGTVTITYSIKANATINDVSAGQSAAFKWDVDIKDSADVVSSSANANLFGNVKPVVVTGTVVDGTTGAPISGANVLLADGAEHEYKGLTTSAGKFTFTSSETNPIVGTLTIGAAKKGFVTQTITVSSTGKTSGLRIGLAPKATPSASAVPSAPAAAATASTATGPSASAAVQAPAAGLNTDSASKSSSSSGTKFILLTGIVLIVGGAAVIGFMLYRRRRDDGFGGDPDDDGGTPYDPRSGARTPARTTVGRPSLADAPTMMHRGPLVADEYAVRPDPYAAPPPREPARPTVARQPGYAPQPGYTAQPGYAAQPTTYGQGGGYQQPDYHQGGGYQADYDRAGYEQSGHGQPQYPDAGPSGRRPNPRPTAETYSAAGAYQEYPPAQPSHPAEPNGYSTYPTSGPAHGGYSQSHGGAQQGGAQQGGYPSGPARGGYQGPAQEPGYGGGYPANGYQPAGGYQPDAGTHRGGYEQDYQSVEYPPADYGQAEYPAQYPPAQYPPAQYPPQYPAQPPADNGYGGYPDQPGYAPDAGGYQQGGQPAYPPAGRPPANGYDQGYQQGGYQPDGYAEDPYSDGGYQGPPVEPGYPDSGYSSGGYIPPEQRGSVNWLDD